MQERLKGDFLRWLQGFHAVAETGNVSAAAERLGVSQPAVSHLVHNLEEDLGVHLFTRHKKSMLLTREGHELYEKSISLFEMVKEIRSEIGRSGQTAYKGGVSFATTHSFAVNVLPKPLADFRAQHPGTTFSIITGAGTNYTVDNVISATIDFGIAPGRDFPEAIQARHLLTTRLVLAAPKSYTFTRDNKGYLKNLEELDGVSFMIIPKSTQAPRFIETEIVPRGIQLKPGLTTNNSSVIKTYVGAGMGVAIVEDFTSVQDREQYDVYPLPGEMALSSYYLLTRRRKYLPPQTAAFIARLLQEARSLAVPCGPSA